jgi:hypothetical protein
LVVEDGTTLRSGQRLIARSSDLMKLSAFAAGELLVMNSGSAGIRALC